MSPRFAIVPARAIEDRQLGNAALRVLCCLGTYSDTDGWCRPSTRKVAARLGISRQTTIEHLKSLAKLGYIEVWPRARPDGGCAANEYRLLFDRALLVAHNTIETQQEEPTGGVGPADRERSDQPTGTVGSEPTPPVGSEPTPIIKNAPIERTLSRSLRDQDESAMRFDNFWQTYPSRRPHNNPKKSALAKFVGAVKRGVDPAMIIAGAERYAAYVAANVSDPRFIAQAVTWLNEERWNDDHGQQERRLVAGMI